MICDCGQHYQSSEALAACQASGHRDSARLEAAQALADTPPEARGPDWFEAWEELG